jgi:type IV secretory pathway VirJ component
MRFYGVLGAIGIVLLTAVQVAWADDFKPTRPNGDPLYPMHYLTPDDPKTIHGLVVLISDNAGWDDDAAAMARHLVQSGNAVAGLELPIYRAALEKDTSDCVMFSRDLETLARTVEETLPFAEFRPPVILGIGAGAGIAYGAVSTVYPNTFAAGVGLHFDPTIDVGRKLCLPLADPNAAAPLTGPVRYGPVPDHETPWLFTPSAAFAVPDSGLGGFVAGMKQAHVITGTTDDLAAVDEALKQIPKVGKPESSIVGLPVVELAPNPAQAGLHPLVIFYSGDGGWRDIDAKIGGYLADQGYPVIGIDALRYFWREKKPETMAADLDRLIRHYRGLAKDKGVILVGYSFGADVLPFMVNRMAPETKAEIKLISLLGISEHASFEIRLQGILGAANTDGPPTLPELMRLHGIPIQCVFGATEQDSVCGQKALEAMVNRVEMSGGHHFDGDYRDTADLIIGADKMRASKQK